MTCTSMYPQALNLLSLHLTEQRSLPPVPISNLNVVVPAQAALIQIHGGEVEDNLKRQITAVR